MLVRGKEMAKETQLRAQVLGEEIYEFFLREASEYSNPNEWYELAMEVAYQFQEMIKRSARSNLVTPSSRPSPSGDFDSRRNGKSAKRTVVVDHSRGLRLGVRPEDASPNADPPADSLR
jgi:hypothetical protein